MLPPQHYCHLIRKLEMLFCLFRLFRYLISFKGVCTFQSIKFSFVKLIANYFIPFDAVVSGTILIFCGSCIYLLSQYN